MTCSPESPYSIPSPSSGRSTGPPIHMYGLHAARGDRHLHLDHRPPLGQRGGDWDSLPLRGVGRRHRRRPAHHRRRAGTRCPTSVGTVRDLEGRPGVGASRRPPSRWYIAKRPARTSGCSPTARTRVARRPGGGEDRQSGIRAFGKPTDRRGAEDRPAHRPLARSIRRPPPGLHSRRSGTSWPRCPRYLIERRCIRAPGLFALYIAFYSFGRFWIELVRIDPANHILGLRVNTGSRGSSSSPGSSGSTFHSEVRSRRSRLRRRRGRR